MTFPPNDSHAWPLIRLVVVVMLAVMAVSLGYSQGWVTRSDLPVVLTIAAGLLGVDLTQFVVTKKLNK